MLEMEEAQLAALRRHGEETYPHECCGVLLGRGEGGRRVVTAVRRCTNIRQERLQDRYEIDARELIAVQREARAAGLEIVGFYHSHPDHPAQFSKTDLAEAHWIGCSYVITAVEKGRAQQTNSFALLGEVEENKRFEAEELRVNAGEPVPQGLKP